MDTDAGRDVPGRTPIDLKGHTKRGINFLLIGGVGFIVDAAVFNALVYWNGSGPLFEQPLLAKVIAILVATVVTYYGNAWLTFRDRPARRTPRQFVAYGLLNVAAILIQLACIGFSRYVLGLADPVSDNVSGTLIGQALATLFRYFTYSRWVFPHDAQPASGRPAV
jgi:putative flippase GtrA